jgi:hypothetical protein
VNRELKAQIAGLMWRAVDFSYIVLDEAAKVSAHTLNGAKEMIEANIEPKIHEWYLDD